MESWLWYHNSGNLSGAVGAVDRLADWRHHWPSDRNKMKYFTCSVETFATRERSEATHISHPCNLAEYPIRQKIRRTTRHSRGFLYSPMGLAASANVRKTVRGITIVNYCSVLRDDSEAPPKGTEIVRDTSSWQLVENIFTIGPLSIDTDSCANKKTFIKIDD